MHWLSFSLLVVSCAAWTCGKGRYSSVRWTVFGIWACWVTSSRSCSTAEMRSWSIWTISPARFPAFAATPTGTEGTTEVRQGVQMRKLFCALQSFVTVSELGRTNNHYFCSYSTNKTRARALTKRAQLYERASYEERKLMGSFRLVLVGSKHTMKCKMSLLEKLKLAFVGIGYVRGA